MSLKAVTGITALTVACLVAALVALVQGLGYVDQRTYYHEATQPGGGALDDGGPALADYRRSTLGAVDIFVSGGPGLLDDEESDIGFREGVDELVAVPTPGADGGPSYLSPDGTFVLSMSVDPRGDNRLTMTSLPGKRARLVPMLDSCDTVLSFAFADTAGRFYAQHCEQLVTYEVSVDGRLTRTDVRPGFFTHDDCLVAVRSDAVLSAGRRAIVVTNLGEQAGAKVFDAAAALGPRSDEECYPVGELSADLGHAVVVGQGANVFTVDVASGTVTKASYGDGGRNLRDADPFYAGADSTRLLWTVTTKEDELQVWSAELTTGKSELAARLDTADPLLGVALSTNGIASFADSDTLADVLDMRYYN